jgi:mono/diheme cytochrome c family protein
VKQLWIGIAVLGGAIVAVPALGHAQAIDIGRAEYAASCAVCHGTGGKGDGPLAAQLKKAVPDLTNIEKTNRGVFPFDRVYDVIDGRQAVAAHGPREMPVWGNRYSALAGEEYFAIGNPKAVESFVRGRIIALIGYIHSLQAR